MNEQQEREVASNIAVLARKLADRDRQIACLTAMNRLQQELNDQLGAELRRLLATSAFREVGRERNN